MPDTSIMLELCGILGITVNELLSGEEINMENYGKKADENLLALKKADENHSRINVIITVIFTVTMLSGIIVCAICDLAVNKNLTWSLIPFSSILFAWVISFPVVTLGRKGMKGSLAALSIFLIPYLYVLSIIIKVKEVFTIGIAMSAFSILYLWLAFGIIHWLKGRMPTAVGSILLMAIPFTLIINFTLTRMLPGSDRSVMDIWDILSDFILMVLSGGCFLYGYCKKRQM